MKLRIKGNSLRLRVMRSELEQLQRGVKLEESVRFAPDVALRYTLGVTDLNQPVAVSFASSEISTLISHAQLASWSSPEQVGIYGSLRLDTLSSLEFAIEKDFACLDGTEEENADAFVHPLQGASC